MNVRNRVWKSTIGIPAEIVIAQTLDVARADYFAFVASAAGGAVGVFWDDKAQLAVADGDAALPANANRKIFYGYKTADGLPMRTTGIPVRNLKIDSVAYNAGRAEIWTVAYTGTISVGQIIQLVISDTTSTEVPYPRWEYAAVVSSTITAAVADLAAQINAEKNEPRFTATASTGTLTITAADPQGNPVGKYAFQTTLKPSSYIEVTAAQPTDASIITFARTQTAIAPIGTYADVKEFENYFLVMAGSPLYTADGTYNLQELGLPASNVVSTITYGYGVIKSWKEERGETRNYADRATVIIALPTASVAALDDILVDPTP
jgi:hypothetical protein